MFRRGPEHLINVLFFNWIWTNSGLKLLLYGTRLRINYCPPGNIGNWGLQHSPESWKYWKTCVFDSVLSWKYWKTDFLNFPISWKYWKYDFCWFLWFFQKRRAPKFHAEPTGQCPEISHMRPSQGQKLKLFQNPISRWRRRRGPASYLFSVLFYYSSSSVICF